MEQTEPGGDDSSRERKAARAPMGGGASFADDGPDSCLIAVGDSSKTHQDPRPKTRDSRGAATPGCSLFSQITIKFARIVSRAWRGTGLPPPIPAETQILNR